MCFVREKGNWDIKVAKEDIECYKDGNIIDSPLHHYSYFRDFKYIRHKLYKIRFWSWKISKNRDTINEGFHTHMIPNHNASVRCIIPKGSRYLANNTCQEYVSNKIIIGDSFKVFKTTTFI